LQLPLRRPLRGRRGATAAAPRSPGRSPAVTAGATIADPAAPTAVYMPTRTIGELTARAIAHGLAPDTPALAVASATRPDETTVAGTVADIGGKLAATSLAGPGLVFIGPVFAGAGAARIGSAAKPPHLLAPSR